MSGENSSEYPTSEACAQSTPLVAPRPRHQLIGQTDADDRPDQRVELEAGRPRYQVPRFQMIAPISSANTMANPALDLTWRISSTGSNASDAVGDRAAGEQHAEEVEAARPDDGQVCRHRMGVDDRRDRVRGVVKPVHELEAERDQQRHAQQHEGQHGRGAHAAPRHVDVEAIGDEKQPESQDSPEDERRPQVEAAIELGTTGAWPSTTTPAGADQVVALDMKASSPTRQPLGEDLSLGYRCVKRTTDLLTPFPGTAEDAHTTAIALYALTAHSNRRGSMTWFLLERPRARTAVLGFFLGLAMVTCLPPPVVGQVATGSIVGSVTDSSGQVVPGAQVTIRHVDRNTSTSVVTDDNGAYTALFLVPGTYEVHVGLQGFKGWRQSGLVLQVNDRLRIDAALEVGGLEETTTVLASAPVVARIRPRSAR